MNTFRFSYRGLSPHKFTPMPGVHKSLVRMADSHRTVQALGKKREEERRREKKREEKSNNK